MEQKQKEPFYNQIEKYIIVAMFAVMVVIIAINVATRFLLGFTLSWGEQLARLLLVWTSFAGISWAGKIDAHMRVTAVSLALKKHPKVYEGIYLLGDAIAVIYSFYISSQICKIMLMVMKQGQVLSALPLVPKWIMYLAGVLGMAGFGIRVIQRRVSWFKNLKKEKEEA